VWSERNTRFSALWPNITNTKEHFPDADEWSEKTSEEKAGLFSEKPGEGD